MIIASFIRLKQLRISTSQEGLRADSDRANQQHRSLSSKLAALMRSHLSKSQWK
jgi:hypothetical protein